MVDSIGNRLKAARLQKQLTVEDVARATKIRPARVIDLENDDYSNFANITYARGFLVIYAKYLGLDISAHLDEFKGSSVVGIDDYQYLNSPIEGATVSAYRPRAHVSRRGGGRGPLMGVLAAAVLGIMGLAIYMFWQNVQRLPPLTEDDETPDAMTADEQLLAAMETPPPMDEVVQPEATPEGPFVPIPIPGTPGATPPIPGATPGATPVVTPAAQTGNQIVIRPLRPVKLSVTRVKGAPPYFEGELDPNDPTLPELRFEAEQVWIRVADRRAVQIFRNQELITESGDPVFIE